MPIFLINWKSVVIDYIKGTIDVNSRNKAKTLVYLLKEDTENNPAYRQSTYSNKLVRNSKLGSSDTLYIKLQNNVVLWRWLILR